jgi:exosome complex component RRP40
MSTFVMPGELQNGFIPINAGFIINNSEMHSQLYSPKQKDSVLGVILSKIQETYKVDIGTTTPALLGFSAFEGASKRNRPTLLPGDLVFARISFTDRDMETELECMNADGKTDGYGQLQDGYLLKCSTLMSKKYFFFN